MRRCGVVDWTDRLHDCGEMSNRVSDWFRMKCGKCRITTMIQ